MEGGTSCPRPAERCQIKIDLGIPVECVFYLYKENPYELVGATWEQTDSLALYAGFIQADGTYSGKAILPASVKKVWMITNNLLIPSPIEIERDSEGNINYSYSSTVSRAASRGVFDNGVYYPKGYELLGSWDAVGRPDYLLTENIELPSGFLKRCNGLASTTTSYSGNETILIKYPSLSTTDSNVTPLIKNTELVATYFKSTAGFDNMLAYYTYNEGETVDINTVRKTILFPRYNTYTCKEPSEAAPTAVNLVGSQVQMKYWNKATQSYQNEFPAGTRIGWALLVYYDLNNWKNEKPNVIRYADPAFNLAKEQRAILLMDTELDNHFFMAMEDNMDDRFNDAQFAIMAVEPGSVNPLPTIPDEQGSSESITYQVQGTLAYEDQWPIKGDYDMNDVVINFSGNVVKKSAYGKEYITRTVTTFTAVNNGASYTNGFGLQLDHIERSSFDPTEGVSVSRDGHIYLTDFEEGTEKPTLILFSNNAAVLGKTMTVDLRFKDRVITDETLILPPYNPFIFVNTREHEVHLPGYLPTSKADDSLRGTGNDLREDSHGNKMYYISKDNMPFSLFILGQYFEYPDETQNIMNKYPNFVNWRDSQGQMSSDWYKK